jgi:valyl-tRNA synthetase
MTLDATGESAAATGQDVTLEQYRAMTAEERALLPKAKQKKLAKLLEKAEQKALKAQARSVIAEANLGAASATQAATGARANKSSASTTNDNDDTGSSSKQLPPEYIDHTPKGAYKTLLKKPMSPAYYPRSVEAAWYDWWEAQGFFTAQTEQALSETDPSRRFVMVMPPPNVTGTLHLGHTLMCAIQDCLTRWHRMRGHVALWVPGTDHAGIATQTVVERKLMRERNLTRHDLGRDDFVRYVWAYKEEYGGRICDQLRRLGVSVDWSREQFTMNEQLSKAVVEAFVRLYERGLIYRGTRLVNWCCRLRTALSDIEVEYVDIPGRELLRVPGHDGEVEVGVLTRFAYPLKEPVPGGIHELVVATTRLETMLGDVAVAVHPEDPRYRDLVGAQLVHPFLPDRELRVIADAQLVDMSFGTGCVKVTPAHDPNDYECGLRHGLPFIVIFDDEGHLNEHAGAFSGLMRYEARVQVERALAERGYLRGKESHAMRLALCSRTHDIIEPMLKPQWWVKCDHMAREAVRAADEGQLTILPEFHRATWNRWLENIHDWCVSRQLWWGHRIPAWRYTNVDTGAEEWIVARNVEEARQRAPPAYRESLEQDEDVLDTWFSSGLFPFSVFGWPDTSPVNREMHAFYPTTLLETGHDILFFWVARMVMLGLELTGKLPFSTVYLHALVRDKYGRKMSKSLGNVIDPLEVIEGATLEQLHAKLLSGNLDPREVEKARKMQRLEYGEQGIPECGTDALRFGLLAYTLQGRDINLDVARVVAYRHFCNKLWNAVRFALGLLHVADKDMAGQPAHRQLPNASDDSGAEALVYKDAALALEDRWILSRLAHCAMQCHQALSSYEFAEAVQALHHFWLYELCDVYLEAIKPRVYGAEDAPADATATSDASVARRVLLECLDQGLRLLHPMMPFVTEELYQRLPLPKRAPSIMTASYPEGGSRDEAAEELVQQAMLIVRGIRSLRTLYQVKKTARPQVWIVGGDAVCAPLVRTLALCGTVNVQADPPSEVKQCGVQLVTPQICIYLHLAGLVDVQVEKAKAQAKLAEAERSAQRFREQLQNYDERVPESVRERTVQNLNRYEQEIAQLTEALERFSQWS